MPVPPARLKGKGRFPIEWNLIHDWFVTLASTFFRSDGTIKLDLDYDHLLMGIVEPEIIRAVQSNEDIPTFEMGDCRVLNWVEATETYDREERSIHLQVRNDFGADITRGQEFLAGLTLDGNWEAIGVSTVIALGNLTRKMRRGETASMVLDSGTVQNIADPGQIPSAIELDSGNRVTVTVGDPGILISYDCEATTQI